MARLPSANTPRPWLRLIGLALICGFLTFCGSLPSATYPIVSPEALLIDARALPSTLEADPCTGLNDSCLDRKGEAYRVYGDKARHVSILKQQVLVFESAEAAYRIFLEYDTSQERTFRKPSAQTTDVRSTITYQSTLADHSSIRCGIDIATYCRYVAQYRNYTIIFFINIDNGNGEGLNYRDINPILENLDRHVAKVLQIS